MPTSRPSRCPGACSTTSARLHTVVYREGANARILIRADALLKLDADWSEAAIRDVSAVGASTIWQVRQRYAGGGLEV